MKNTGIATLLALLIPTLARAASPESFTINVNDRLAQEITVEQAEPAVFTVTFMDGASPYDLNGKVPFMFWSKSATIPPTVRASFSVVSITGGVVQFSFTAADLNLTNGTQTAIYGIGVQNYPQTVARGRFRITPNPYSSGAGDIPWATNVMWGTIPWVGMPIFLTNLHSAGQSGSGGVVVDAGGDATITFPAEVDPIFTNSDVFGITHADRVAWSNSVIRSQTNESDIAALRQDLANETAARTNADASIRHDLGTDVSSLGLSLSNAVAGVLGDVSALSSDTVHRVSGSGRISASGTTNVALTFDASGLATTGEVASVAQAAGQAYSVATNALDIAQQAAAASIDQTARDGVVAVGLVATNALNIALAASNRADSAFSVATNATLLASNAFAQGSSAYTIATNALQKAGDASNVAASAYLTATNAAALATQAQAHADSAYLYATNAEAVALAAYPASNPSNFITSSEVTGLGTDTTARAWAQAASNRAEEAYSLASTNVPAGVVTTSDVGTVTYAMIDPALLALLSTGAVWGGISGDLNLQTDLVARLTQMAGDMDAALGLVETNLIAQHTSDMARVEADIDTLNQQMGSLVLSGGVSVVTYGGFYADEWARGIMFSAVPRAPPSSNALVNPHVDAAAMRFWSDVTAIDYWASLLESRNNTNAPVVWSVGNPALASVDTNGFITSLLPGTTTVAAAVGGVSVSTGIALHVATHGIMDWQVSGPIGYWRRLVYTSLVDRITNEASSLVMSAFDHATTNYQWRTNGPMAGVDLSAAPIWNSRWNSKHNNGILIAPKILLTAEHSLITPGTRFRFLTPNNELVERTTVRAAAVPGTGGGYTDAQLHELDEAITNIQPVRLLGSGWWNYVYAISLEGSGMRVYEYTNIVYGAAIAPYLPIFDFDNVGRIVTLTLGDGVPVRPNEPWLNKFWRNLTGGDSGGPLFMLSGDEPVLLGVVMVNSGKPGAWVWDIQDSLNQTLSEMCPTCDTIQWYEGFTNYIPKAPIP